MSRFERLGGTPALSTKGRQLSASAAIVLALLAPAEASSQSAPGRFMPGSVSGEKNDYNLSISADGRLMVFARSDADFANATIMISEQPVEPGTGWSAPQPIAFSADRYGTPILG